MKTPYQKPEVMPLEQKNTLSGSYKNAYEGNYTVKGTKVISFAASGTKPLPG